MSQKIEIKSFELQFKDVDSSGMIRGYDSTFGNVDLGLDIVDKGAFKKSLKETGGKIPILADHNPSKQIGWNLRAEEDDKGLYVEGKLDLNVQDAREKYSLAKSALEIGAKSGLSIGYMTIKAEPDREKPMVRRIKEVKLFEYSFVTFPMNTAAMVTAMKSQYQSATNLELVKKLIEEIKTHGISEDDLRMALGYQAAPNNDPSIAQSLQDLIKTIRS